MNKILLSLVTFIMVGTEVCLGSMNVATTWQDDCGNSGSGLITVIPIGGVAPYSYQWSVPGLGTSSSAYALHAGNYTCTVTDNTGDFIIVDQAIVNFPALDFVSVTYTNPGCGLSAGTITVTVSGGTPPFSYVLHGSGGLIRESDNNTSHTFVGVPEDTFRYIEVNDAGGCTASNQPMIIITVAGIGGTVTPSNCSSNTGAITLTTIGGTSPFSYHWNNGAHTQNVSGLTEGYYSVTVTDANSCTRHQNFSVPALPACLAEVSGKIVYGSSTCGIFSPAKNMPVLLYISGTTVSSVIAYTNALGDYDFSVPLGTYSIGLLPQNIVHCPVTGNISLNLTNNTLYSGNDFVIDTILGYTDAGVTVECNSPHSDFDLSSFGSLPASTKVITAQVANVSSGLHASGPVTGQVSLVIDPRLTIIATNPVAAISGNNFTWNYNIPFASNQKFSVACYPPVSVPFGTILTSGATLLPSSADFIMTNNNDICAFVQISSFDPNEKTVTPSGDLSSQDSILTYTIYFQNVGNDTAYHISITDTLDANLDATSLKVLMYSHEPTTTTIYENKYLVFDFANINLPDSFVNKNSSNGYIKFAIKRSANAPEGTTISNKAFISFDYNQPVMTNTVTNTISTAGIAQPVENMEVEIYPNPADNSINIKTGKNVFGKAVLMDISGKELINSTSTTIDTKQLAVGVYICKIVMANGNEKFIKVIKR